MKNNLKKYSKPILLNIFLFLIIINHNYINNIILISINLWLKKLLPSIYPIMVIGKLLINNHGYYLIPKSIEKIFNKLFKFNNNTLYLIIISFIVGSPTSQVLVKSAYINNQITYQDFKKIIITTSLVNPFFFWNIVSFLNIKQKIIILAINYLITIILWLLVNNKSNNNQNNNITKEGNLQIITNSFKVMIDILAIIIIFNIFTYIIVKYLGDLKTIKILLINMEITNGFVYLKDTNFNPRFKLMLTSFLTSFLGICINNQIKSIIKDKTIYNTYFKINIIKSLIVALISCMFT